MICQSSAANIRFETMKRLKKTSASKRFSLKNIHLLSYQETRWPQLADAEARQGESQSQSNLTLLVFSLNTAKCFCFFPEKLAFGFFSSCSVSWPCSQARRSALRHYRNVVFGVSPTPGPRSISSARSTYLAEKIIRFPVPMSLR